MPRKKKKAAPPPRERPAFLEDQQEMNKLVGNLEMLGFLVYKRLHMSQAFEFIEANLDILTDNEKAVWDLNYDDMKTLSEMAGELLEKNAPPKELAEMASKRAEKEKEETHG